MLKSPKKTKYKSPHLRLNKKGLKGFKRAKKTTIIKSLETYLLKPKHLETSRRILVKPIREDYGDVNFRFFPDLSISKKPLQTRMGKGKGDHHEWVAPIKKGRILLEILGKNKKKIVRKLYRRVSFRLPVHSKLILHKRKKNHYEELLKLNKHDLSRNLSICN